MRGTCNVKKDIWNRQQLYRRHGKTGGFGNSERFMDRFLASGDHPRRIDVCAVLHGGEMYTQGTWHVKPGVFRFLSVELEAGNRGQPMLFFPGCACGAEYTGGGADGNRFGTVCILQGRISVGGPAFRFFEHLSFPGIFQV